MKRILLSALFIVPTLVIGQIIDENFDNYANQDYAGVVSPVMSTWSGTTGGSDDCFVTSAESSSPNNSITITGANAGGAIDAMVAFPSDYTTGRYEYSMKFKVAAGMGGYFNLQSNSTPGTAWLVDVLFAADGTGSAAMNATVPFTYTNGAWIDILFVMDLDADMGQFFIDGTEVGTGFTISLEAAGTGSGANLSFGGINLYSLSGDPTADCEYYVDDIMLVNTTGVGVDELNNASSFTVFPNPATTSASIEISLDNESEVAVRVLDVTGKQVAAKNYGIFSTSSVINLNTTDYPSGIYLVEVSVNGKKATKRLIIK
jgi:hypothetical protein